MTPAVVRVDPHDGSVLDAAFSNERRAFDAPPQSFDRWLAGLGPDDARAVVAGDRVVAYARCRPLGQFWGGRPVPMGGICDVAVAPEQRGRGLAQAVLRAQLRAMHDRGLAVSVLYPAVDALYRRLGWELAGGRVKRAAAPSAFAAIVPAAGVGLRPADPTTASDRATIEAVYRAVAATQDGFLDRPKHQWDQMLQAHFVTGGSGWRDQWVSSEQPEQHVVLAEEGGSVTGYLRYRHAPAGGGGHGFVLVVLESAAVTVDAGRALWRFLTGFGSLVREVRWHGPRDEPLLLLGVEATAVRVLRDEPWMLRLLDLPAAMAARGFPRGVRAALTLSVRDGELAEVDGAWRLSVEGGRGMAERVAAAHGAARVDVGMLASLWAGWARPATAVATGRLEGASEADLDALTAMFPARHAWFPEFF